MAVVERTLIGYELDVSPEFELRLRSLILELYSQLDAYISDGDGDNLRTLLPKWWYRMKPSSFTTTFV